MQKPEVRSSNQLDYLVHTHHGNYFVLKILDVYKEHGTEEIIVRCLSVKENARSAGQVLILRMMHINVPKVSAMVLTFCGTLARMDSVTQLYCLLQG